MKKGILLLTLVVFGVSSSAFGLSMWQRIKWVAAQGAAKATLMLIDKAKTAPEKDKANYTLAAEQSANVVKGQLKAFANDAKDPEINTQVDTLILQIDTALQGLKAPAPQPAAVPSPA